MTDSDGIVLVCMPFGHVFSPSIGLSLLKSELAAEGMPAEIRYFSIRFAELVGQGFYYGLSYDGRPSIEDLAGEWIFSRALFGPRPQQEEEYVDQILLKRAACPTNHSRQPASSALVARIQSARRQVEDFLQWCLEEVLRAQPKVVGFTSMFQQHVPSLALARLVKQARPKAFIVFGGANCEGVMGAETVRQFSFVDAAVSGEADLVFPELARRVLDGREVSGLPGVRTRDRIGEDFASGRFSHAPMVRNLDSLPYPDYRDYFEQFAASRFGPDWQPSIYLETSRGCWWGERMHCTFCGLNDQTMAFRSKSARRALDEIGTLTDLHPGCDVEMTDNILDMGYFKDVVPALAARRSGPMLFYEVKSNLRKDQVRMLRDAGIRRIQPGIESFSDPVLKLMRKGVTALQNIQLLKWCKELGIKPAWNLLWGFPGEPPDEYHRMAALVPLLTHLPPPESYGMIRLDRFSPNFDDAERLGFADVTPLPPYRYVYPLSDEARANLACFFTFRHREPRDLDGYVTSLEQALSSWRKHGHAHDVFSVDVGDCLLVWDLRPVSCAPLKVLRGADRILYEACDGACDLKRLVECLERAGEGPVSADVTEQRLERLREQRLVVRDGSRYLALAIPLGEYSPPMPAVHRFYEVVRALGKGVPSGWVIALDEDGAARPVRTAFRARVPHRRGSHRGRAGGLTTYHFSMIDRSELLIRRRSAHQPTKGGADAVQKAEAFR